MKKILSIILVLALAFTFAACSGAPESKEASEEPDAPEGYPEYTWTAALNVAETTINYMIVEKFATLINERSNGAITVNIYPGGQLGGDNEITTGCRDGSIDLVSGMSSGIVDFVPESGLFDLPNLFPNVETMRTVLKSDFFDVINKYNKAGGFMMLGYSDAGFRELSSNKEIRSVDDITGIKLRVMNNENHIAYWKSLGANPVAMDFSEVYVALQQGAIDGQENPYMNIVGNNFHEVQKYIVETNHLGHIITFYMNNKLYESLPDNVGTLVDECAAEAIEYGNSKADESIAAYKQTCIDAGCKIVQFSPEDLAIMQQKADIVYQMVRENLGDELVDTLLKAVEDNTVS